MLLEGEAAVRKSALHKESEADAGAAQTDVDHHYNHNLSFDFVFYNFNNSLAERIGKRPQKNVKFIFKNYYN